jgi:hypothetical protein
MTEDRILNWDFVMLGDFHDFYAFYGFYAFYDFYDFYDFYESTNRLIF